MADARVGFRDNKRVEAESARVQKEAESARVRVEAEGAICDNLLRLFFSYLVKRCGYTNITT